MEKQIGEDEIKGLEEEIDLAVDRLFVEKKGGPTESFMTESPKPEFSDDSSYGMIHEVGTKSVFQPSSTFPPVSKPIDKMEDQLLSLDMTEPPKPELSDDSSYGMMQEVGTKGVFQPSSTPPPVLKSIDEIEDQLLSLDLTEPPKPEPSDDSSYGMMQEVGTKGVFQPSSTPPPVLKSIDKMEAQLLSLEWEVTKANIEKTKEEVLALREDVEGETETIRVLNLMEKVLMDMLNNEKNIDPSLIKFLLDSKETIKLLMNKETDQEINIYKQLAYTGIEARFDGLEGLKETKSLPQRLTVSDETEGKEIPLMGKKKIDQMVDQWNRFSEKLDDLSIKMDQHFSKLNQMVEKTAERPIETKPASVHITVIKVDEKLFGVESEKVLKLFKVPDTFCDQYAHRQKIRLKEFEVKVVDLNKIFSIQGGERKRETKILTVKENGEYKGLMVDGVLKKLSTQQDLIRGEEEYFLGMIHSIYQEQRVEIPILDLKKF